jgi:fructokinase
VSLVETPHLVPRPGGAPANLAIQLARLGCATRLISAVGDDPLGQRLAQQLSAEGVDTRSLRRRADRRTGLTLVDVAADAERSFTPWRQGSADLTLRAEEVPAQPVRGARALCLSTVTLRAEPVRSARRRASELARAAGVPIALDVNLRYRMFPSRPRLLALARRAVREADIVKATDDEARALYGDHPLEDLAARILEAGASLCLLTLGPDGAIAATPRGLVWVPAPKTRAVDATGAGDAFFGAALYVALARAASVEELADLEPEALAGLCHAANHAGAQATTEAGATTAMVRSLPV